MAGCTSVRPFAAGTPPPQPGMRIEVILPSPAPSSGSEYRQSSSEQLDAAPYTIAWMSDTQYYCRDLPNIFFAMTRYLQENREKLNLGYVVHTGDIVDTASSEEQWAIAKRAMDGLLGIPHGVLAGNHDVGNAMDYRNFRKYFGETSFAQYSYYGGSFKDNRCHYDLITLGQTEFVFVYLGFQPAQQSMEWANEVFARYPKRIGILCVHEYLDTDLTLLDIGKDLQEQVVKPNANVYMVLCGHRYTQDCVPVEFDDDGDGKADRTVYQCIADYQDAKEYGGNGYMRFISVEEAEGVLRFYSYSPILDDGRSPIPAVSREQILPIPWK